MEVLVRRMLVADLAPSETLMRMVSHNKPCCELATRLAGSTELASAELQHLNRRRATPRRYMVPGVCPATPGGVSPECTRSKKTSSEERGHFSVTATPCCISTSPVCTRSPAAP